MLKKTKIICTQVDQRIEGIVDALIENGMNCARFNTSWVHGRHPRAVSGAGGGSFGKVISLILDTKGPEMRLGNVAEGKVQARKNPTFTLTYVRWPGDYHTHVSVNHKNLLQRGKTGRHTAPL